MGRGSIWTDDPPIIAGRRVGAWEVGLTPSGPAAYGEWRPNTDALIQAGLGIDWDGSLRAGVGLRARF